MPYYLLDDPPMLGPKEDVMGYIERVRKIHPQNEQTVYALKQAAETLEWLDDR